MELKVGMYVRTEKGIAKIIDRILEPDHYYFKMWVTDNYLEINDDTEYISEVDVLKASNNIIDLIECLDIVELYIIGLEEDNITTIKRPETLRELKDLKKYIKRGAKIKSITTKEQFESMSYKVVE